MDSDHSIPGAAAMISEAGQSMAAGNVRPIEISEGELVDPTWIPGSLT